jgi:hypothetical protein
MSVVSLHPLGIFAQDTENTPYSPALRHTYPDQVLWGDLHLHSNLSMDAYTLGNTALSPDDAYRFAKGKTIESTSGGPAKLSRPLDFLSVTDHAEYVGAMAGLTDPDVSNWSIPISRRQGFWSRWFGKTEQTLKTALQDTPVGKRWAENIENAEISTIMDEFVRAVNHQGDAELIPNALQTSIWNRVARIADTHNDPGHFTALIGYEWTTIYEGNNLHRVVIYKDAADKAGQLRPFSAIDSQDPEDLWASLARYEEMTGGDVLAIPHNGNLSNGTMFAVIDIDGNPIDADYAARRARWEPIYEVTQVKGDGEAHPTLSPDDEFADFENWDDGNIAMSESKTDAMLKHEYGRSALKLGLQFEQKLGVNPYKFGLIGSTDSHTGLSTSDNDNFFGKFPGSEPTIQRFTNKMASALWPNVTISSSGYTAVWAKENTRDAIFDALKRKEVYASTGPRISLRLFAGWDLSEKDLYASNFAERAYAKGVPMGGTLSATAVKKAPTFLIHAMRDPIGANLDRAQIVKAWVDSDGKSYERIYNVSLSDGRTVDANGRVPPVGNTVDVTTAHYSNDIGAAELSAAWTDPNFNPDFNAFYYARVLEIPTPRWSTYDAVRFGVDLPNDVPGTLQERVYSSPIWYDTVG